MKKIFRLIAALAATTVAFSCMEEANPETPETGKTNYDGPVTTLEFTLDELETKTVWDGENHTWAEGDMIKIIWMDAEGKTGDVEAEVVDGKVTAQVGVADTYYAVYPETTAYTLAVAEGQTEPQLSVVIPQTQDGSFRQANIMAAKTTASDKTFAFKNLTHIFKFTLSEDSEHQGFQFMSNSSQAHLTGCVAVTFNDDAENPVTIGEAKSITINDVTYTLSSVVQVGNLPAGGTYYVGFRPDADMTYGFGFKATKSEGTTGWSEGALSTNKVETNRSAITFIKNLDKAIRTDWYFKEEAEGKGDGSDWENAGSTDLLVKLLGEHLLLTQEETVLYNKNTNGWRLYGADLHLAAGTYELPTTIMFQLAVNNRTKVLGGYPDNLTGTSLEGRDASQYKTIISKNGGSRLFAGNGSTLYNWTWDGITFTFKEGTTSTDRGSAFYFNASTKGTVSFIECTFENLKTNQGTGGGAIDFNTADQTFKATFKGCKFLGNCATKGHGGAIVVEAGEKAELSFENCEFSKNSSTAGHGGAISLQSESKAKISLTGCSFSGNFTSTSSAGTGGAIYSHSSIVIVDRCSFVGNGKNADGATSCYEGGAIFSIDAAVSTDGSTPLSYLYIYDSYFTGNAASNQAGAVKAQGGGYMAMINSTVSGNTTTNGVVRLRCAAAGPTSDNGLHAYIVNSTFADSANSFYNQQSTAYIYNTAIRKYFANGTAPKMNLYSSVMTEVSTAKNTTIDNVAGYYDAAGTVDENVTDFTNLFGTYAEGIVPVGGIGLTHGMQSTALSALGTTIETAMPLFDVSKLTVDQKGNSREGKTIMGAYVGE